MKPRFVNNHPSILSDDVTILYSGYIMIDYVDVWSFYSLPFDLYPQFFMAFFFSVNYSKYAEMYTWLIFKDKIISLILLKMILHHLNIAFNNHFKLKLDSPRQPLHAKCLIQPQILNACDALLVQMNHSFCTMLNKQLSVVFLTFMVTWFSFTTGT